MNESELIDQAEDEAMRRGADCFGNAAGDDESEITVCPYCGNYAHDEYINCCGEISHGVRMTFKDYMEGKEI